MTGRHGPPPPCQVPATQQTQTSASFGPWQEQQILLEVLSQLGPLVWKPGGFFVGVEAAPVSAAIGVAELGWFVSVPAITPLKAECC